jgi:hypothetical protein
MPENDEDEDEDEDDEDDDDLLLQLLLIDPWRHGLDSVDSLLVSRSTSDF